MALVALLVAKRHLRLGDSVDSPLSSADTDLQLKLDQAEAIVLNYIKRPDDADWSDEIDSWTEDTVPGDVQAAILYQVGELHRFRGDDVDQDKPRREDGYPTPAVKALLHGYHDPALA